eukprot:GHRR01013646.1.p1 GENE.GHRR01013646.1~~GHRR01013646.1.p1  ORF type:complete len:351 (+),score=87.82 GHRR01013646.1:147-1199(+)
MRTVIGSDWASCSITPQPHLALRCQPVSRARCASNARRRQQLVAWSHQASEASDEQAQDAAAAAETACQPELPLFWCQGLFTGTYTAEVKHVFPDVEWRPQELVKMLCTGLPAVACVVLASSQLAAHFADSRNTYSQAADAAATAAAAGVAFLPEQQALLHLYQEAVPAILMPAACWLAVGSRVVAIHWDSYWVVQTVGTCAVLFPLVDPILFNLWAPAVQGILGPVPASSFIASLQQAGDAHDWISISQHCLASGVLGPVWEEVFWRGFFLTALTKVLPLPACVALSSVNFAMLHLSPHNFLPLLVLSACCDCLYMRSGGNLLAPLLLHGFWNNSQILQIALLHKDTFV